jgi:hypothetical protein
MQKSIIKLHHLTKTEIIQRATSRDCFGYVKRNSIPVPKPSDHLNLDDLDFSKISKQQKIKLLTKNQF